MEDNSCFISAPFLEDQVRSINRFQRDRRFHPLTCSCGGMLYAKEEGLTCKICLDNSTVVQKFIANWFWNKFKYPVKEEEDGID